MDLCIGMFAFSVLFWCAQADPNVHRRPGREDTWSPTVVGSSKRDLLRDVLLVFGMIHISLQHYLLT